MAYGRYFPTTQGIMMTEPIQTSPGDIVLVHRKGLYSFIIARGQSMRFKGPKHYKYWTHIAVVTGSNGQIVEAVWPRVRASNLEEYRKLGVDYEIADIGPWATQHDRVQVANFAEHAIGTKYGLWEAAGLSFWCINLPLHTSAGNQLICSALGAEAACRSSIIFQEEPLWMTPAHHAEFFNIPGRASD